MYENKNFVSGLIKKKNHHLKFMRMIIIIGEIDVADKQRNVNEG